MRMKQDPIVEEVRKARRQIEKECDNDFAKLFAFAKASEKLSINQRLRKLRQSEKERLVAV